MNTTTIQVFITQQANGSATSSNPPSNILMGSTTVLWGSTTVTFNN